MGHPRKNVLVIITDQQRSPFAMQQEGGENLHLPGMDRLARYGMQFENACCNSCMCSPSRSTLFTGRYPAQHGVTQTLSYDGPYAVGQHSLDFNLPNMGNVFAHAGYDTQYRGKWHLSKAPNHPLNPEALQSSDVAMFGFKGWIPPDAGEDADPAHFGGGWPDADATYVAQARDWLVQRRDSGEDRPFLMVLSLVNPHDVLGFPRSVQYGYPKEMYDPEKPKLKLPPNVEENLATNNKPSAQAQLLMTSAFMLGPLNTPQLQQQYLNFYGSLCEYVDTQINGLLKEVFFDGANGDPLDGDDGTPNDFFKDTVVLRLSDHGEMGMSHGGLRQKAFNVYEETLRVPMIWSNPDIFPGQQTTKALASLVDVMPTLVGNENLLGNDVDEAILAGFAGADLSPVLQDPDCDVQQSLLFTYDDIRASSATQEVVAYAPDRIRCVRTKRWKYAEYHSADSTYPPEYELYDLTEPTTGNPLGQNGLEYDNLYYAPDGTPNPDFADRVAKLRAQLADLLQTKCYTAPPKPPELLMAPHPKDWVLKRAHEARQM